MVDLTKLITNFRRSKPPKDAESPRQRPEPEPQPWPTPQPQYVPSNAPSVTISLEDAYHGCERIIALPDGRRIALTVPPGIKDGQRIAVPASRRYRVLVKIDRHMWFSRIGDDIHSTALVDQQKCLLGGPISVRTIDGSAPITLPLMTQPGHKIRLTGRGMPHQDCPNKRGDHVVTVQLR